MRALAIVAVLATGCASRSQLGPYVKSIARIGTVLRVQRCMLVLEGDTLREGACTNEDVPLAVTP